MDRIFWHNIYMTLANAINSFIKIRQCFKRANRLKSFRLGLIKTVAEVLAQGLGILGD